MPTKKKEVFWAPMRCPLCNHNTFDEKFCSRCGTRLVKAPKCKCGEALWEMDKFCDHCGRENPIHEERRR